MTSNRARLTVATDGSCLSNPGGAGGWAWVVSEECWGAGGSASTTNQRMELQAIGQVARAFPSDVPLLIQSDSQYSIKCLTEWLPNWLKNNWVNSAKKPVANRDLIEYIAFLLKDRDVTFEHVRGHRGHVLNEIADMKCGAAAEATRDGLPVNEGPAGCLEKLLAQHS
ncbi:ribonuclease HI [Nakamurella antarctica]|uniref:ribonuclease H n=1 Tax=Nakamurella antarctica TaxID=1902245 RepID=A0A3G8ZY81_9ACTN|nr:ribonuclease H [Nakamurella antarctica]AZI58986.1 ribonuclease HI [Nakamurella antarctica]